MFAVSKFTVLSALFFAAVAVAAPTHEQRLVHRSIPNQFEVIRRGYAKDADKLEPYAVYKARFNELDCESERGKPYFDKCCHPLLKGQNIDHLPESCWDVCDDEPVTSTKKPAASSTKMVQSTTKAAPKPTKSVGTGSGSGAVHKGGFATYYLQGGNAGSCGQKHSDDELIVAIDHEQYGNINKVSPLCGKKVHITNTKNGKSVTATIADVCPTCENGNSIDLSKATFQALDSLSTGMFGITWTFV
jgi:hypothetical protein